MSKDIDFVRLQLEPLAVTVQANARAWVKELGRLLKESAKQNLMSLKTEIEVCLWENFFVALSNEDESLYESCLGLTSESLYSS